MSAAADLVEVLGAAVAYGLLMLAAGIVAIILLLPNPSILGWHPLGFIHSAALAVNGSINRAAKDMEHILVGLLSGLVDSLAVIIGTPIALALSIKDALTYLWHTAIRAFVAAVVNPVRTLATKGEADAQTAIRTAARDLTIAEHYADTQATRALDAAKSYAHTADAALNSALKVYINGEVSALRAGEDAAIASARAIAVGAEDALRTVEGAMTPSELAALLASIPALAVLLHAIATEAGLDTAECRSKVKGICGTGTPQWLKLLEGIGLMAGVLDFKQLLDFARIVFHEGERLVMSVGD